MEINLKYASLSVWQEVSKKVKDAAVFIDEPAAECLSWHGGVHLLLDAGARSVREFSSFEKGDGAKKAVFIVSSPLTGQTRFVLRDLISDNSFEHSILVTSCSPAVLTLATTGI
ncbi:unnamed protein product [Nesidiocoris tenuis]|uniref:Uncharacterized protein n=1 Tax=Nesidiocoris tenuis TaxID=355587 RepID=A0A6H5HS60_9HEMI|nr:unnamed protein product [Nesidiocoris tenuis]